jgi:hypothetical protein
MASSAATIAAEIVRTAGVGNGIFYFQFADRQDILPDVASRLC